MQMLSEDDGNLKEMSDEELALAWDLWFDLASQPTKATRRMHMASSWP